MPLLERADRVELLRIDGNGASGYDIAGSAVRRHLSRHAIDATFRWTSSAGDTGATLLSQVADASANLLVMGAHGHTPLREALFGGTTRTVLKSMTMPVLMSR
jgi:nucleotide-binding universal stress UspA family protein